MSIIVTENWLRNFKNDRVWKGNVEEEIELHKRDLESKLEFKVKDVTECHHVIG